MNYSSLSSFNTRPNTPGNELCDRLSGDLGLFKEFFRIALGIKDGGSAADGCQLQQQENLNGSNINQLFSGLSMNGRRDLIVDLLHDLKLDKIATQSSREYMPKFHHFVRGARVMTSMQSVCDRVVSIFGSDRDSHLSAYKHPLVRQSALFLRALGIQHNITDTASNAIETLKTQGGLVIVDHPTQKAIDPALVLQYMPAEIRYSLKIIAYWEHRMAYKYHEDIDDLLIPIGTITNTSSEYQDSDMNKYILACKLLMVYIKNGGTVLCMRHQQNTRFVQFLIKMIQRYRLPMHEFTIHTDQSLPHLTYGKLALGGLLSHVPGVPNRHITLGLKADSTN